MLTSLWKENIYLASAWTISYNDFTKDMNTVKITATKMLQNTE